MFALYLPRTRWPKIGISLLMLTCLSLGLNVLPSHAEIAPVPLDDLASLQVPPVPGASNKLNASFRNTPVADAFRMLAKACGFNVILDESVTGNVNVSLKNITLLNALSSLRGTNQLAYSLQGNTLLVTSANAADSKAFNKTASYIIPLKYANAVAISNVLNGTLFANADGSPNAVARPDFHTNSMMLQATLAELATAQSYVAKLDKPRAQKTWRLSHANAMDVASLLGSSVFNNGLTPPLLIGAGAGGAAGGAGGGGAAGAAGGAGGAGGAGAQALQNILPASLRVRTEKLEEGTQETGTDSNGITATIKLRARVLTDGVASVNSNGPILMPDTRLNTLTLLGTAEQIEIVDSMIPILDRKLPQLSIEASLLELTDEGAKELGISLGLGESRLGVGFSSGLSTLRRNSAGSTRTLASGETLFDYTTISSAPFRFNLLAAVNALIQSKKAKLIANPNVIAMHDHEAVVSIVDEIVRSITVTQSSFLGSSSSATSQQTTIGQAGIVLSLRPTVGANGMITLKVWPAISTVRDTQSALGNVVTLLSKRFAASQQVVMQDGQTLVLSGLIQETNTDSVNKIPGLSDLPIVGALARSSTRNKKRSELVIMITPHILPESEGLDTPTHVISSQSAPL